MNKRDRLRRVVLLCVHFSRNLAYHRAGHSKAKSEFWITVHGNFLDMAVIEWCKLFGAPSGKHHWKNVVTNQGRFETGLLEHLGVCADQFASYVGEMRRYRDKFVAHLDDLFDIDIALLDRARAATDFYHRYIVVNESAPGDLSGLPTDLADYYRHCFEEANATIGR